MIRFKVVKGSHLLLAVSVIVLAVVIALFLFATPPNASEQTSTAPASAILEAKAVSAFASDVLPLEIEIVRDPAPTAAAARAKILIYHTHTHEAYRQIDDDPYVAVEAWRTTDDTHSVVRVGAALTAALRELGYEVIHDETDHELDELSTAYERSLQTLESYDTDFDLLIDLHRDAYVDGLEPCCTAPDGTEYAQIMLLVGRGDNYLPENKPDYEENLRFAQRITRSANAILPGICRNVTVKKSRYNQHLGKHAILVEVGHNQNTLQQALACVDCLAEAIDAAIG